jgi:pSer/pThr/pTyr-binding forkhead associated (FHA) protein
VIDYDLPENATHYIVLESISSNTSKVIHVVNMSELNKLFIGRGHDAHVRVTDISVSRLHAIFYKAQNGYFYLTDNDSKFGTLALMRQPLQLTKKMRTQL